MEGRKRVSMGERGYFTRVMSGYLSSGCPFLSIWGSMCDDSISGAPVPTQCTSIHCHHPRGHQNMLICIVAAEVSSFVYWASGAQVAYTCGVRS